MLELLSFLFTLGTALKGAFNSLKKAEKKKVARKLHQIHVEIQVIIDNAERLFRIINNANKYVNEYGKDKFSRILSDNFYTQFHKLILLVESFQQEELSVILSMIDSDLTNRIKSIACSKGDSIRIALQRLSMANFSLKDDKLHVKYAYGQTELAFPELQEEINRIEELKKCSKEFGASIYSAISLEELL